MTENVISTVFSKYNPRVYPSSVDIRDVIKDFPSDHAYYLVDLNRLIQSYETWMKNLPNVKPYYAVKCNPNVFILEILASLGVNFDCASENEMKNVLKIVDDPNRIVFANPCKMSSQIRYARSAGIHLMTFDCEEELYKVRVHHPGAKMLLRLAVDDTKSLCKFNKKFGCRSEEVEKLLTIAKTIGVDIVGFSFHVGSGCSSADVFYSALETTKLAVDMATALGFTVTTIDIGGGFPGVDTETIHFEDIAIEIRRGVLDFFSALPGIKFIAEPGRFFAEPVQTLVVNIIGKKTKINEETGEKNLEYTLNEGVYHSFNCILFDHAVPVLLPLDVKTSENVCMNKTTFFGYTCDSMDTILENVWMPELAIGDCLYVENFGAYTSSASTAFNGFEPTDTYHYVIK